MALQFNNNGLEINTFRDLFQELSDGYKAIYGQDIDLDQESPDGQRVAIEAQAREDMEAALQWLYSQMDPAFNTGDMQQVVAKLHGLFLRPGSRSQRDLKVTTDRPVLLYNGYRIRDQANQVWFIQQDVTVPAGTTDVTFFAQDFGKVTGLVSVNRPGFPGECFVCELRLPDHRFRWKRNRPFPLLPAGYDPAVPATVGCCTSPPTSVWPAPLRRGFSSSVGVSPPLYKVR